MTLPIFCVVFLTLAAAIEFYPDAVLQADVTCCNTQTTEDACDATFAQGGSACEWLEYGVSDQQDTIITQSGSQCVGLAFYECRTSTGGCCAPGCNAPVTTASPGSIPTPAPTRICSSTETTTTKAATVEPTTTKAATAAPTKWRTTTSAVPVTTTTSSAPDTTTTSRGRDTTTTSPAPETTTTSSAPETTTTSPAPETTTTSPAPDTTTTSSGPDTTTTSPAPESTNTTSSSPGTTTTSPAPETTTYTSSAPGTTTTSSEPDSTTTTTTTTSLPREWVEGVHVRGGSQQSGDIEISRLVSLEENERRIRGQSSYIKEDRLRADGQVENGDIDFESLVAREGAEEKEFVEVHDEMMHTMNPEANEWSLSFVVGAFVVFAVVIAMMKYRSRNDKEWPYTALVSDGSGKESTQIYV